MNVKLLRKVVKHAETEPRRFNMETWYGDATDYIRDQAPYQMSPDITIPPKDLPPCGVVGCIAGQAAILTGLATLIKTERVGKFLVSHYQRPNIGWFFAGRNALELTQEQAQRLFFHNQRVAKINESPLWWPEKFSAAYMKAKTPKTRVKVLRARVEHFIKTNGEE